MSFIGQNRCFWQQYIFIILAPYYSKVLPLNVIRTTYVVSLSNGLGLAAIALIAEVPPGVESFFIGRISTESTSS